MARSFTLVTIAASLSSAAAAETSGCRTDSPTCQGYTTFGPAAADRCISIRGETISDFCQKAGDRQRVFINAGDRYCAVAGTEPVPAECEARWITVTEPQ